jgi:hypothetical protein
MLVNKVVVNLLVLVTKEVREAEMIAATVETTTVTNALVMEPRSVAVVDLTSASSCSTFR